MKKFLLSLQTYFRILFRTRDQLFWCLLFPILLSTMFHFAFAGLITETNFTKVPVAVSSAYPLPGKLKTGVSDAMKDVLEITFTDSEEQAEDLLRNGKAEGAVFLDRHLAMQVTVPPGSSVGASILAGIAENYNLVRATLIQTYREDGITGLLPLLRQLLRTMPGKSTDASSAGTAASAGGIWSGSFVANADGSKGVDIDLSRINFYSLIAMFCLFASMSGMAAVIMTQANLSEFGKRISLSSASHLQILSGFLCAGFLVQLICILIGLTYMHFVLGVDFGSDTGSILLITAAGCLSGVCLGFFVGSIGAMKEGTKNAILMVIIFGGSAAAGLFGGNGFIEIEHSLPVLNRINPVALITDAVYAGALNGGPARYAKDILQLLLISALLFAGGVIMQRKKTYESL